MIANKCLRKYGVVLENQRLFGAICSLHRTLIRQNDINLSVYGISAVQFHTLIFVHINTMRGCKVCQRDIERETGLRPSSVSSMLSNLERAGLIERASPQDDARTKCITLTAGGIEICKKNKEIMDKCDERIGAALSEEEQLILKKLLVKVQNNLDNK